MEFDYETHLEDLDERFKKLYWDQYTYVYRLELSDDEMRFLWAHPVVWRADKGGLWYDSRPASAIKAEWERSKVSYMFVGPSLLFTVFTVVPVVLSIVLSFTDFNTLRPPKWVPPVFQRLN